MDSKILEYVIAVAENKSLSRTAEQFYLSQPILSRHVKNIEEELGVKLFERTHNQMLLTDAGRIYINNARAILYTEQKLLIDLENLRNENRSVIRVMVDPYLRPLFERAILPEFRGVFQACDVEIIDGNEKIADSFLKNKLARMAVLKGQQAAAGNSDIFFADELVLTLPREWDIPDAACANEVLRTLRQWCLLMEQSDPIMRECERRILKKNSAAADTIIEVEGSANLLRLVEQKKGAAILPLALAQASREPVTILHFDPTEDFYIYGMFTSPESFRKEEKFLLECIRKAYREMDRYMKRTTRR